MLRIFAGLMSLAIAAGTASAADYRGAATAPGPGYAYGALPDCQAPPVLARISQKFATYDANVIMTGLRIDRIDGISERALKLGAPGLIDRRFCGGRAWLSNGSSTEVVYLIEGPKLGPFSAGWHVESCLPGYDPWRVHDARCRSIRP